MGFSGISGAWRRAVSFKLDDLTVGGRFVARGVGNERLAKGTAEGLRQAWSGKRLRSLAFKDLPTMTYNERQPSRPGILLNDGPSFEQSRAP